MGVSQPSPYDPWVNTLLREGKAFAAIVFYLTRHGDAPARARSRAEDVLQEALSKVIMKNQGGFSDFQHFRHTVIRSAINLAISDYRKQRRVCSLAGKGDDLASPEGGLRAWSPLVRQCLEQLPDGPRRLLELYFEERYSLDELANHLLPPDQRSDNARRLEVWRRLRGAFRQIREYLLAHGLVLPGKMAGD
jgi:DNA-directed RNA polymerase specialized sigma24 family protein